MKALVLDLALVARLLMRSASVIPMPVPTRVSVHSQGLGTMSVLRSSPLPSCEGPVRLSQLILSSALGPGRCLLLLLLPPCSAPPALTATSPRRLPEAPSRQGAAHVGGVGDELRRLKGAIELDREGNGTGRVRPSPPPSPRSLPGCPDRPPRKASGTPRPPFYRLGSGRPQPPAPSALKRPRTALLPAAAQRSLAAASQSLSPLHISSDTLLPSSPRSHPAQRGSAIGGPPPVPV